MQRKKRTREEAALGDAVNDEDASLGDGDEAGAAAALDEAGVKRLVLAFERALTRNTQLRVKHAHDPTKFVDSEVELDEAARALLAVAAQPQLFPVLVATGAVASLLALLAHENADIALDAIAFLKDATDVDAEAATDAHAAHGVQTLLDALLAAQLLALLVATLQRLDEAQSEERQGVHSVLAIAENVLELRPELAQTLVQETALLAWLLARVQRGAKEREMDEVKLYASELLAILVQSADAAVHALATPPLQGVDALLTTVARYKKAEPSSPDEEELVENLFDVLCVVAVGDKDGRRAFAQAEGLKLLQIIIKNKVYARRGALKLLDYVLQNDVKACRRWVQLPGLGTLFAALVKQSSKRHKKAFDARHDEEHVLGALWSLLRTLRRDPKDAALYARVLAKFHEDDMLKLERLCELHAKYRAQLRAALPDEDEDSGRDDDDGEGEGEGEDEEEDEEALLARLDAGAFVLRQVDAVLAEVVTSDAALAQRAQQLLTLHDSAPRVVARSVRRLARTLGADETQDDADVAQDKAHLRSVAQRLSAL